MLNLTDGGAMMGGPEAIEFFERLDDVLDTDIKDNEFCDDFTHALNRCRYSVARDIPLEPTFHKGRYGSKYDYYTCARCGYGIDTECNYCPCCGQLQTRNYLGRRATKEEQFKFASPAEKTAAEEVESRKEEPNFVKYDPKRGQSTKETGVNIQYIGG